VGATGTACDDQELECGYGPWAEHSRDRSGNDGVGHWVFWVRPLTQNLFVILKPYHGSNLYSTFITPWADQSAAHSVEPDFELPPCYNLTAQPPGPTKAAAFSDETLFFMFYSSPRDALQEVAAQEL
jgi:hypothetical protein